MSKKQKYEVVSIDVSDDPSATVIDWVAITTESNQLCPYVVLEEGIFKTLGGYQLLKKDLFFAENVLRKLEELENQDGDQIVKQSLWFASVVTYGKCFTDQKGRGIKLDRDGVFKGADQIIVDTHDMIMQERHQYIAHAGDTNHEVSNTMVALSPDINNKELLGLYHSLFVSVGILTERIQQYISLVQFVKAHIESVLDKLYPASLAKVEKTDVNEWYEQAEYPLNNIEQKSNSASLTAPSGGVLKKIRVRVEMDPGSGGVLIYGAPNYDQPQRFNGPVAEGVILTTEPNIYIQRINGTQQFKLYTLGYEEQR